MNWLTKWFIHQPVGANLLMFAILVSGLLAYGQLRVESFPQIAPSSIAISVSYPGGSAQQIDDSVTQRCFSRYSWPIHHRQGGVATRRALATSKAGADTTRTSHNSG